MYIINNYNFVMIVILNSVQKELNTSKGVGKSPIHKEILSERNVTGT